MADDPETKLFRRSLLVKEDSSRVVTQFSSG